MLDLLSLFQSDLERLLADAEKRLAWLQSENEGIDSSDKVCVQKDYH